MTPFSFDTLSASKQLREAGMPEGMAEAVVSVFQHAAMTPDISHLATKDDLERETASVRADMATKRDLLELEVRLMARMRLQGWAMMGGAATIVAVATAIIKLV